MRPRLPTVLVCLGLAGCASHVDDRSDASTADPIDQLIAVVDAAQPQDLPAHGGPILFVHGINGSAADFTQMIDRFVASGWPADLLFAHTFADPKWGCNVDNATQVAGWVDEIRAKTGTDKITLVAHSMGTLSTRYFLEHEGGDGKVGTYVTFGGMHHGLATACSPDFPFKPCVWTELCSAGAFIADLNTYDVSASPVKWISIYGTGDTTVPNASSMLAGAEMIAVPDATHVGLISEQPGYDALRTLF